MQLEPKWTLDPDFPSRAWGTETDTLEISGQLMHLFALRVSGESGSERAKAWEDDFQEDVDRVFAIDEEAYMQVTELPGLEGWWLIIAHPHCD